MRTGPYVSARLRRAVVARARGLCEYCGLRQDLCPAPFEVDHILPRALDGETVLGNLCLACPLCNNAKRARVVAREPRTNRPTALFNPRIHSWNEHFRWSDDFGMVHGISPVGRATVATLRMNQPRIVQIRLIWASLGLHPPD
jgi:5-methylcytosine-specific restriction endonuclease McrA